MHPTINDVTLQHMDKCLQVTVTSDWRQYREIYTQIRKAKTAKRELQRSVVTKQVPSTAAKVSSFHEPHLRSLSWAVTERVLSQAQAADMVFLLIVSSNAKRQSDTQLCHSYSTKTTSHYTLTERSQLRRFNHTWPECGKKSWRGDSCWLQPWARDPKGKQTRW